MMENHAQVYILSCKQTVAVMKEYHIMQHYKTLHKIQYEK